MVYRHSSQLYNEQTLVPMIVYVPGLTPRRISDYVSTIDLGPTILSAVGIDIPRDYVGVSLVPLMRGEPFVHPTIYGEESYKPSDFPNVRPEENPQTVISKYMMITQEGYKLIFNRAFNTYELFNLKQDPKEENNLFNRETGRAREMAQQLGLFVDIVTASRPWDADESRFLFGRDDNRESWNEGDF
jgi:arylsulfatase A-like enzyme